MLVAVSYSVEKEDRRPRNVQENAGKCKKEDKKQRKEKKILTICKRNDNVSSHLEAAVGLIVGTI